MAAQADRYHMYYDKTRYKNTSMTRLKGAKKKTKKKSRKELVRDMLDYMADDFQDVMREKKRMEEEAFGIQRFPRGMDAEIERRRKEERHNRKKKNNKTERGIFNELELMKAEWHILVVYMFSPPILEWLNRCYISVI